MTVLPDDPQFKKPSALIGHSGFVGSTLKLQTKFDCAFRSHDILYIDNQDLGLVVCAGAPAQKWIANRDPVTDMENINSLIKHLKSTTAQQFVLISTVDVFLDPSNVLDENQPVITDNLHAYGLNRYRLEEFVKQHFENHLIIRLPGLVGPGLRKNIIYDFKHDNNLANIESRSKFQFYPMVNLWADIQSAMSLGLNLVHFTSEPISVSEVAEQGFGISFNKEQAGNPVSYNFKSAHATKMGGSSEGYLYSKREVIQAIRAYAQYPDLNKEDV